MSRTDYLHVPGLDADTVVVIRNADWSGEAIVRWTYPKGNPRGYEEVRLPGLILAALIRRTQDSMIDTLKDVLQSLGNP